MSNGCATRGQGLILACSGGSNVGQITNQAAIELERGGLGRVSCSVGVAAGIDSLVNTARQAPNVTVLDGCAVGCAKAALLERAGREPDAYVLVTDLGVAKAHDFDLNTADVALTVTAARQAMGLPG